MCFNNNWIRCLIFNSSYKWQMLYLQFFLHKMSPSWWQIFYYKYDPSIVDLCNPFLYIHLMGLSLSCSLKTRDSLWFHGQFQQRCASLVQLVETRDYIISLHHLFWSKFFVHHEIVRCKKKLRREKSMKSGEALIFMWKQDLWR